MNPNDPDQPASIEPVLALPDTSDSGGDETPAVVKRRRAPRKKPAGADAGAAAAALVDQPAPSAVEPVSHASDPSAALEAHDTAMAVWPASPRALPPGFDPASDGPGVADAVEQDQSVVPDDPAQVATQDGPRRSRNRRRGRRGSDPLRRAEDTGLRIQDDTLGTETAGAAAQTGPRLPAPDVGELFANVLSGDFDIEGDAVVEAPPAEPTKRVLAPEPDAPKLQKVLAQSGIGSRRDMEQLIQEGRITVNGAPAHVGQRISFGDQLRIDGKPIKARISPPPPRVLAYHKPAGEVVTHDDPQHRPTVFCVPRLPQGKWQSVGRLDINTEGLLLFTNSGELANQLMHPRFGVEREYAVRVLGVVDETARTHLLEGVAIDGQTAAFKSIEDGGGEGANRWYRVVITEGRNREVRKLFEAVGHAVSRLIRIRYGPVVLPRGLRRGLWVDLEEADVWTLRRIARPQRPAPPAAAPTGEGNVAAVTAIGAPADLERRTRRGRKGRNDRRGDGGERAQRMYDGPPMDAQREPRPDRAERGEGGPIPNPLQQTYDKRAIQQARALRADISEDGPIPNPLQQTYDKRAMQQARSPRVEYGDDGPIPNPLQQTYDKRFVQNAKPGPRGAGARSGRAQGEKKGAPMRQPDPMQTAVGYIGADAFTRKAGSRGRNGPGGGAQGNGGGAAGAGRGKGRRGGRGSGGSGSGAGNGGAARVEREVLQARIQGFAKFLIQECFSWPSNVPCRSSSPMPWQRM